MLHTFPIDCKMANRNCLVNGHDFITEYSDISV